MRTLAIVAAMALPFAPVMAQDASQNGTVPKPAALIADGIPEVPVELASETRP